MDQAEALSAYKTYVKQNPAEKEAARKSFYDTFGTDPEATKPLLSAFQKQAASRKLGIDVEQHAATMNEEIASAKGKAAGDIGKAVVLGGAALASGGLAAAPAAALMGVSGVGAATAEETIKSLYGSTDMPKSAKGLALKLGAEGVLSAAGEAGARAVGQGLKYLGKEVLPALAMRSAAKAQAGQQALVRVQQDTFDQLRDLSRTKGNPTVDIGDDIVDFFAKIRKRATGSSQAFKDATKPVFAKLWKAAEGTGGSLEKQPLDALMEIKSDLNHIAYKSKSGMNTDELVALRKLADNVDKKIVGKLDELGGPAAKKIYSNFKAFTEQISRDDAAGKLADNAIQAVIGKKGLLGLVPGVDPVIRSHMAPWVLEQMFSNAKTAALVKKAINMEAIGQSGAAQKAFNAAVNASGVGTAIADALKEAPNAAPAR